MSVDLLLVKTSSLGDVVHALPVLSDLALQRPDCAVAWVVEESFTAIPRLHPFCQVVVPVALRRWRKRGPSLETCREWAAFKAQLRSLEAKKVLDLQGLLKSAWLAWQSPGERLGFQWGSARENLATLTYHRTRPVPWSLHAVERNRLLAASHFGYSLPERLQYGIAQHRTVQGRQAVFIHSSSREDKLWAEASWVLLGQTLAAEGFEVILVSGNLSEYARAQRLESLIPGAKALQPAPLEVAIQVLRGAALLIGVDTGLTHLAVALTVPTIAIYTATDPKATGVWGGRTAVNIGGMGEEPPVGAVLNALKSLEEFL